LEAWHADQAERRVGPVGDETALNVVVWNFDANVVGQVVPLTANLAILAGVDDSVFAI
jgi:hypothetical protein